MRRQLRSSLVWVLTALTAATGCHPAKPFYLRESGDLSHYLDKATEIEHPDVDAPRLAEVDQGNLQVRVGHQDLLALPPPA